MKNLSSEIIEQIRDALKRQEGAAAFTFTFDNDELFNWDIPGDKIFEIISGKHYFLLERTDNFEAKFYHSSPGTGTRVATIDLNAVIPSKKVFFYFVWSPNETRLSIGPKDVEGGKLVTSEGEISQKKFQIGEDGKVVQVGDEGVEVMALSVYENGKQTLKPSALDNWKNSIFSVEKLINGTSIEGYIFESIVANQALSILITGFETYSKARFRELEQEGIKPELEELVAKLFSLKKQEAIKAAVVKDNLVLIEYLVNGKKGKGLINFQDYALCKKVFKITYDIDFDELNIASKDVSKIKKVFNFRHKIIHVSPLSGMLNQDEVPSEDPIFSNKKFVVGTLAIFDDFIKKLHATTLRLKRND